MIAAKSPRLASLHTMQTEESDEIHAQLTPGQLLFLKRHAIPVAKVFDAAGYSQPEWREQMSLHEMVVAINVRPCREAGHRMRTSGGHCVQCRPANLAYQERYRREAYVYILGSKRQRILKVGYSESPQSRADHLNLLRYGSATDWTLLFYVRCERAGAVEHSLLSRHSSASVFGEYWKDRKYQKCFELLRCDYTALLASLSQMLDEATMQNAWMSGEADNEYSFATN